MMSTETVGELSIQTVEHALTELFQDPRWLGAEVLVVVSEGYDTLGLLVGFHDGWFEIDTENARVLLNERFVRKIERR